MLLKCYRWKKKNKPKKRKEMQSKSCVTVKCEPNNFRVASSDSGNVRVTRVAQYNSTSLWFASCGFIIKLWIGSLISLHYIKSAFSVYIISSLHVKQSKKNKVIWYIPFTIYSWIENEMEKNASIYANIGLITEAAVQSQGNHFSTNFGIFSRKQPW